MATHTDLEFSFDAKPFRVLVTDSDSWYSVSDAARILGADRGAVMATAHPDRIRSLPYDGVSHAMLNNEGLYDLIFDGAVYMPARDGDFCKFLQRKVWPKVRSVQRKAMWRRFTVWMSGMTRG